MKTTAPLLLTILILFSCQKNNAIKIACVGDSITEGAGITPQSMLSYPVQLSKILGDQYAVLNAGRSATTLMKDGNFPYWTANEFSNVFAFKPDIIIIKLGTNDTKPENWNEDKYRKDYQALIDTFNTLETHPKIWLCQPVPVFKTRWGINDSTIVNGVMPTVKEMAATNNLPIIDLYSGLQNQKSNFTDDIHPNAAAAGVMAEIVAGELLK